MFIALDIVTRRVPAQQDPAEDISLYVLKCEGDVDLGEKTLKGISNSVDRLIQKAEKQQPKNLRNLVGESKGFEGVKTFDRHHGENLCPEFLACWSLAVVTLTSIAISLPNIQKNMVDRLLSSVGEGLDYVKLVEESLNTKDDHVCIQKAAKMLWLEVKVKGQWLGNSLQKIDPQFNTAKKILQWFMETAENKVNNRVEDDAFMAANSMYRIAATVEVTIGNDDTEEQLFNQLVSMIADILAACFTNLPQVIAMKCYASAIERREASVKAAAQLLGETMQIIEHLQNRDLPGLNPDDMAFIDKWRAYLNRPTA